MNYKIYDWKDLSDSKEVLARKPPLFGPVLLYTVAAFLVGAFAWAFFGRIDVVIKAAGTVRPNERISTIVQPMTGRVEQLCFKQGDMVHKGDVLYTLHHEEWGTKKSTLEKELGEKRDLLAAMETYKRSLEEGANYLDLGRKMEEPYYRMYQQLWTESQTQSIGIQALAQKEKTLQQDLLQARVLSESVRQKQNRFAESAGPYYLRYGNYQQKRGALAILKRKCQEEERNQESLYEAGAVSLAEVKRSKEEYAKILAEESALEGAILLQTEEEIQSLEAKVAETGSLLRQRLPKGQGEVSVEEGVFREKRDAALVSLWTELQGQRAAVIQLETDIRELDFRIEKSIVQAPMEGFLNVVQDINVGDILSAEAVVGTIIPENSSYYTVQIYVPNGDISKIKVGDTVKYHFSAFQNREYGDFLGKVIQIPPDSKGFSQDNKNFYVVEADIGNKPLRDAPTQQAVKVGMVCEARIVTKSQRILDFVLEKLDLKE